MFSQSHNEIFQSYKFSQDFSWLKDRQDFNDEEDLVFLCNDKKVGVGVCTAFAMFPHLREILRGFSSNYFSRKDEKIFVTLDNSVDPDTLKHLIQCFSENREFTMSLSSLAQVRDLLKMFGSNLNNFDIVRLETKTQEGEANKEKESAASTEPTPQLSEGNDPGCLALAVSTGESKPAETEETEEKTAEDQVVNVEMEIKAEEKLPSASKAETNAKAGKRKGGTKRKKNILEAVENIAAKRRAKEPKQSNHIEATSEVRTEESEKEPESEVPVKNPDAEEEEESQRSQVKKDIKKILPHLTITPLATKATSDDPQSETRKEVESGAVKVEGDIKCPEEGCSPGTSFKTRTDFLHHLVPSHYSGLINTSYPWVKDQPCPLCPSNKTKKSISVSKQSWQKHLLTHEALLELFRPELKSFILSLPKRVRGNTKKLVLSAPEESVTLDETPADESLTLAESETLTNNTIITINTTNTTSSFIETSSQEDLRVRMEVSDETASLPTSSQEPQDFTEAVMEEKSLGSVVGSQDFFLNPLATSTSVWEGKLVVKLSDSNQLFV